MDIFKAIKKQNVEQIKSILRRRNIDIDVKKHGQAPLHLAAGSGNSDIIKIFLDLGADVNIRSSDSQKKTPLHLACKSCGIDGVNFLLTSGANINSKDQYGNTPLHKASSKGNYQIVSLLLARGANINDSSNNLSTALHTAATGGHKDVVQLLLENGVDKDVRNKSGDTAYSHAMKYKHLDIARLIACFDYDIFCHSKHDNVVDSDENCNTQQTIHSLKAFKKEELNAIDEKLSELERRKSEMQEVFAADGLQLKRAQENLRLSEARYKHTEEELRELNDQIDVVSLERSNLHQEISKLDTEMAVGSFVNNTHFYECPICFEIPHPPIHVYQCHEGHIYCGTCKNKPGMDLCPQCRQSIAGLSIRCRHMEDLIAKTFY